MHAQSLLSIMTLLVVACGGELPDRSATPAGKITTIADIQGTGVTSPLAGKVVTVVAVVSGDFQDDDVDSNSNLGGFYLQSLQADSDPRSSEGLFVFDRNADGPDVEPGDVVAVTGTVSERFGETQLSADTVVKQGRAEVAVTQLALPAAATIENSDGDPLADLEHLEGMRLRLNQPIYVRDLHGLERYGEVLLSTTPREFQFTDRSRPDATAYADHQRAVAARSVWLDDGRAEQGVSPVRYLAAEGLPGRAPRIGDAIVALEAVLRYSRGSGGNGAEGWRLMPVTEPRFAERNGRPSAPDVGGNVVVASFNVLNYFETTDNGKDRCGPTGSDGCRGADSAAEFDRQRSKIAYAINAMNADIVGLMEIENDPRESIEDLVAALNEQRDGWSYVDTGVIGADAIRVGLVYRHDVVALEGQHAILDSKVDSRFNDKRNRPALAQSFRLRENGATFTVAVNHLKSKGSPCDEDGDPNRGDGQANCNGARTQAAAALAAWMKADPTGSGDDDALIVGDLNAYRQEDPLRALQSAGFHNLLDLGDDETTYSFVHRGESGSLDHALATESLLQQVTGIAEWHINADEAPLYDYNLEFRRDPALFQPEAPWRASDHDPVMVGLNLEP